MSDPNYTHITLVVDRSGSMNNVLADAEGAVNAFIDDQKAVDGKATLLLVDFDAAGRGRSGLMQNWPPTANQLMFRQPVEADWYRVIYKGDLADAPKYKLSPRGLTALNDAVGRAINETGNFLAALPEDERPAKVVFATQTDGGENSSQEFSLQAVNAMVKHQAEVYSWEMVFLGMGLPEIAEQGRQMGFGNITVAAGSGAAYQSAFRNLSAATSAYRGVGGQSLAGANVTVDENGTIQP